MNGVDTKDFRDNDIMKTGDCCSVKEAIKESVVVIENIYLNIYIYI